MSEQPIRPSHSGPPLWLLVAQQALIEELLCELARLRRQLDDAHALRGQRIADECAAPDEPSRMCSVLPTRDTL